MQALTMSTGIMVVSSSDPDAHASSDWKISTDPEGAFTVVSVVGSQNLTSFTFSDLTLAPGTAYYLWARHNGVRLGLSQWSRVMVWAV